VIIDDEHGGAQARIVANPRDETSWVAAAHADMLRTKGALLFSDVEEIARLRHHALARDEDHASAGAIGSRLASASVESRSDRFAIAFHASERRR
jgi:hypothetical protein